MPDNNNAYIKVKIDQIDARKKQLQAESKQLNERRKAYADQLVDEDKSAPQAD